MTDLDSLDLFTDPDWPPSPVVEREPRKCKRHDWVPGWQKSEPSFRWSVEQQWPDDVPKWGCRRCFRVRDEELSRRNRNNRKRGNSIQRKRITGLGGQNLAGNNPNLDGLGLMFRYESKSAKPGLPIRPGRKLKVPAFPEVLWAILQGIPAYADQTRVLIVTEAPGPGHKARSMVVVDYDDWQQLHGETPR